MSLTLVITQVDPYVSAGQSARFNVAVTNNSSSSVTLTQLQISESTESDAQIQQPNILTPNVPLGVGNPTILGLATANFGFHVVLASPATPGPAPNQQTFTGGGTAGPGGMMNGQPADPNFTLLATAQASDGSIASSSLVVGDVTVTQIFAQSLGGSLQFNNPMCLANGLMLGIL